MAPTGPPNDPRSFSPNAASILATEHWSVLGTRSMAWSEASSRTAVFLTVLSAAVVALALVADATAFGDGFALFALVLFPIVLFLGVTTFARLVQINANDNYYVVAMNRIRNAYLRMAPELEPFFTTGWHDDEPSIVISYTYDPHARFRPALQFLMTTPTVIASINATIAAAGAALVATRSGASRTTLIAVAAVAFLILWLAQFALQLAPVRRYRQTYTPRYPATEGP